MLADSSARDLGLGRRPSDPRGAVCVDGRHRLRPRPAHALEARART